MISPIFNLQTIARVVLINANGSFGTNPPMITIKLDYDFALCIAYYS